MSLPRMPTLGVLRVREAVNKCCRKRRRLPLGLPLLGQAILFCSLPRASEAHFCSSFRAASAPSILGRWFSRRGTWYSHLSSALQASGQSRFLSLVLRDLHSSLPSASSVYGN